MPLPGRPLSTDPPATGSDDAIRAPAPQTRRALPLPLPADGLSSLTGPYERYDKLVPAWAIPAAFVSGETSADASSAASGHDGARSTPHRPPRPSTAVSLPTNTSGASFGIGGGFDSRDGTFGPARSLPLASGTQADALIHLPATAGPFSLTSTSGAAPGVEGRSPAQRPPLGSASHGHDRGKAFGSLHGFRFASGTPGGTHVTVLHPPAAPADPFLPTNASGASVGARGHPLGQQPPPDFNDCDYNRGGAFGSSHGLRDTSGLRPDPHGALLRPATLMRAPVLPTDALAVDVGGEALLPGPGAPQAAPDHGQDHEGVRRAKTQPLAASGHLGAF